MSETAVATLIGDLVGSRSSQDRTVLHQHLEAALAEVNDLLHPLQPMRITVGDEHQGSFATVAEAVQATLLVRVRLLPAYDIRHGIGWGATTVLDGEAGIEDGPGWWAARAAIEAAASAGASAAHRWLRTAYVVADGAAGAGRTPGWSTPGSCCATSGSPACRSARCRCCVVCCPT